jgi:RimJ/RimL family protein N-acetyltransferase
MFGRFAVDCRSAAEHYAATTRLDILSGRLSDLLAGQELSLDAEAQHWLGWSSDSTTPLRSLLGTRDPAGLRLPGDLEHVHFAGGDRQTRQIIGSLNLSRTPDGVYDIGGAVRRDVRGRGYGTELLQAACAIAHEHFGIPAVRAGCEVSNLASARWLARSGFVRADGPPTLELPNGRVVESIWWSHRHPASRMRCRYLRSRAPITAASVMPG